VLDLEQRIGKDVESARAFLGRLLQGGKLTVGPAEDGRYHVVSGLRSGVVFPALAPSENNKPSNDLEGRRPDFVAGARGSRRRRLSPFPSRFASFGRDKPGELVARRRSVVAPDF